MTKRDESYHPRLLIDRHFDALINRIDVRTEELFQDLVKSETSSKEKYNDLNDLRGKQIKEIEQIKEINLKSFEHFNEEEFQKKWLELINDNSIKYEQKIDRIKEEIIFVDCVLLEERKVMNGLNLWITNWFHNDKHLKILKYVLFIFFKNVFVSI